MAPVNASTAALARWLGGQRWFSSPLDAAPAQRDADVVDPGDSDLIGPDDAMLRDLRSVPLPTDPPVAVALVETADGDQYQLLLPDIEASAAPSSSTAGEPSPDLGADPATLAAVASFIAGNEEASAAGVGTVRGHWLGDAGELGDGPSRLLGAEQTNSSAVVGGRHVLKVLRRLQSGPHPELEIGRHLAAVATDHPAPVAALTGWYELDPGTGSAGTVLGVVQELVPGALDGWALVLSGLAADPADLLGRLRDLGSATARIHDALAQPAPGRDHRKTDRARPEAFGIVALEVTRIDGVRGAVATDAQRLLATSIDRPDALAAVVGRAPEVATLAADLAAACGDDLGASIRHHGDLHLGQTVVGPDGWVLLDFEGEPNRPLAERRQRHSPLRDVAGMLRSLAYAAATHRRGGGQRLSAGWEAAARAAYLDGYLSTVDPALLPTSAAGTARLLALFELEKVVYEIGYELAHRPDWLVLPVSGLTRLLQEGPS